MQYLHYNHLPAEQLSELCWTNPILYYAMSGNLEKLRTFKTGFDETTCVAAASHGQLEVLKWLRLTMNCPWNRKSCDAAARSGHLEVLKWLRSENCPWSKKTALAAMEGEYLEVLKYMHSAGCPMLDNICNLAAEHGNIEILRWAHENGYMWDRIAFELASTAGNDVACLQYLYQEDYSWTDITMLAAVEHQNFECFKFAIDNDCLFDVRELQQAAEYNQFEMLQLLCEKGGEIDNITCNLATKHPEILVWIYETLGDNCPWDEDTFAAAAKHGRLDVMEYLRAKGCSWDEDACATAVEHGHIGVLCWLHVHGCPWDRSAITNRPSNNPRQQRCVDYVIANNCHHVEEQPSRFIPPPSGGGNETRQVATTKSFSELLLGGNEFRPVATTKSSDRLQLDGDKSSQNAFAGFNNVLPTDVFNRPTKPIFDTTMPAFSISKPCFNTSSPPPKFQPT